MGGQGGLIEVRFDLRLEGAEARVVSQGRALSAEGTANERSSDGIICVCYSKARTAGLKQSP